MALLLTEAQILELPDAPTPISPIKFATLPSPNAIDQWLLANHIDTVTNVFNQPYSHMGDIPSDQMLCTLQLNITPLPRKVGSYFRNLPDGSSSSNLGSQKYTTAHKPFLYRLVLYASVPETSGIDVTYLSSPIVTLGRYDGHLNDSKAPGWTKLTPGTVIDIRQPSAAVAKVFKELAFWVENNEIVCHFLLSWILQRLTVLTELQWGQSTSMLKWASVISVSILSRKKYVTNFAEMTYL
jgi:hypothetical protein